MTAGISSGMGIGVMTYSTDLARAKDKAAQENGEQRWEDLDPLTQRKLENTNRELQVAVIKYDREMMGTQWGDYRLAGKAVEETWQETVNKAVEEYRVTGDGMTFRDKVNSANSGRRMAYEARNKDKRFEEVVSRMSSEDTAEELLKLGPEQLAIKIYNQAMYGDDMQDEFGNYNFALADEREAEFVSRFGQDMLDYIKDYMGAKYDAPVEYQELKKAQTIMKPYWGVETYYRELLNIGENPTIGQERRVKSLVSRAHKIMRRQNPLVEKYYQMFYTNK
jgi:hypothetical protein